MNEEYKVDDLVRPAGAEAKNDKGEYLHIQGFRNLRGQVIELTPTGLVRVQWRTIPGDVDEHPRRTTTIEHC